MNKSKIIILAISIAYLFFSFKIEKQNSNTQPISKTKTFFTDSINFDAVLSTNQSGIVGKNRVVLPYLNFTMACFMDRTNGNAFNINNFTQVNSVLINDSVLSFKNIAYFDTSFKSYAFPFVWKVIGASAIPSFTYTNNNVIPSYTGYNLLPDTIFDNQDVSITISNFDNANKVQVWLQNTDNHQTIKKTVDNTGIVNFNQSTDLSGFYSQNTKLAVIIYLSNYNIQTISGKKINFINNYTLVKNIVVISSSNSNRIGQ